MAEHIDKAIADLRAEIETVRRRLGMYEAGHLRMAHTGPPPVDTTDEAVADDRRLIESAERAIDLLKAM